MLTDEQRTRTLLPISRGANIDHRVCDIPALYLRLNSDVRRSSAAEQVPHMFAGSVRMHNADWRWETNPTQLPIPWTRESILDAVRAAWPSYVLFQGAHLMRNLVLKTTGGAACAIEQTVWDAHEAGVYEQLANDLRNPSLATSPSAAPSYTLKLVDALRARYGLGDWVEKFAARFVYGPSDMEPSFSIAEYPAGWRVTYRGVPMLSSSALTTHYRRSDAETAMHLCNGRYRAEYVALGEKQVTLHTAVLAEARQWRAAQAAAAATA